MATEDEVYLQQRLEEQQRQMQAIMLQLQQIHQQLHQAPDTGGGKKWDSLERCRNIKISGGDQKE